MTTTCSLRGGLLQPVVRRARDRFRQREPRVVFVLAGIVCRKEFLQAHELCALRGRFADPRERLGDVGLLRVDARHLHQGNPDRVRRRARGSRHRGLPD